MRPAGGETIGDLGEDALLARLATVVGAPPPEVVLGIGDDTAVLRAESGKLLLATCDAQVEGVHFLADAIAPRQLGRRLLAVNLSDIAAMGGTPRWALVSAVLQADLPAAWLQEFYAGLREEGDGAGVALVGGNLARSPGPAVIDLTLLGDVAAEHLLTRSGARPGDALLVTGHLGAAGAGLEVVRQPSLGARAGAERLLGAYLTPRPRVREGQAIGRSRLAHAMMDLSDGLGTDLRRLCAASGVGARVDVARLPVSPEVRAVAAAAGRDPVALALFAGDDYELLVAAPPAAAGALARMLEAEGTAATVIGEVVEAAAGLTLRDPGGTLRPLEPHGWDHFRHR
ncbi:MAG: thiamine-phosphate kinase [Armatimonadetes bacterium]|nr:thiamine-phosphate kinase [Armatimonadota bacterium]